MRGSIIKLTICLFVCHCYGCKNERGDDVPIVDEDYFKNISSDLNDLGFYYNLSFHKDLADAGRPIAFARSVEVGLVDDDTLGLAINLLLTEKMFSNMEFEFYLDETRLEAVNVIHPKSFRASSVEQYTYLFHIEYTKARKAQRVFLGLGNKKDIILGRRDLVSINDHIDKRISESIPPGAFIKMIEL